MTTTTTYLTGNEPLVARIIKAAFPSYTGKKLTLETHETVDVRSYWDGGCRDYFVFVNLETLQASSEVPGISPFHKQINTEVSLPPNFACVRHSFRGTRQYMTILINPQTMNPSLLPASVELEPDDEKVLLYTRTYKSSYNGQSDYRRHQSGMSVERWDAAKARLIEKGFLNKAGAITVSGRNAIKDKQL